MEFPESFMMHSYALCVAVSAASLAQLKLKSGPIEVARDYGWLVHVFIWQGLVFFLAGPRSPSHFPYAQENGLSAKFI